MLRLFVVAVCLLAACLGSAQVSQSLEGAFQAFHYYGLFPGPPTKSNPMDFSGFGPKLPAQFPMTGEIPANDLIVRSVGHSTYTGKDDGISHLEGGVDAEYKGYRMQGDVMDGNHATEVYIISGNAVLTGPDAIVKARRILIDYRHRTYEAYNGDSELRPSLVGGVLQTDVYANGKHSNGSEREEFLQDGQITTCNYPEPHYELDARDIDLRYQKRIIFRDLSVWVLGHHLFNLPFLSLPLDDRHYQNLPVVGEDAYEGYYIKTNYGIPLKSGDEALYTRLDYMTKLGPAIGGTFEIGKKSPSEDYKSTLTVYTVPDIQMLDIQQEHDQNFKWGSIKIQNSYNGHDYLTAPDNNILNSLVNVSILNRHGQTGLSYTRNSNTAPGFDTLQQTFNLNNNETIGSSFKETTQVTYSDSSSSYLNGTTQSNIDNKTINVNFDGQDDFRKGLAILDYQRNIPVGTNQNFVGNTDRTPNLTLQTDTGRLFGATTGRDLPIKTDIEFGQFGDPQSGVDITRDRIELDFEKSGDALKRWHFDSQGQFVQSFYSDDTAQYVVGTNETLSYKFGRDTSFNLRYSYLRPEGYTPLGIDQVGQSNLISDDISVRPVAPLLLGLQSSYDFVQRDEGSIGYSPVGIRAEYSPHSWLLARALATYDPFFKGVANYRLDTTYSPGDTTIGLGARYDNTRSTWAEIDLYVSSLKWGRFKTDLRLSYNGYSNQFNSIQTSFVYDLHCAEAVLQIIDNPVGFQSGTSVLFFIRLKGIPFDTSFGAGTRGQPIGYGTSVGY